MTTRALVIAVEQYPLSTETSATLPGVISAAERFIEYLETNLGVASENVVYCCSGESARQGFGATRREIMKAILELLRKGADDTTQLFVFLSGHGVMKTSQSMAPHEDFLLSAGFESSMVTGEESINIAELAVLLSRSLGAGNHVYFIDSCRTTNPALNPVGLGLQCPQATSGVAAVYQIHSAASGGAAINDQLFMDSLIQSLDGKLELDRDPAEPGTFWVTFRNVARSIERVFAEQNRNVEIRTVAGSTDCRIRSLQRAGAAAAIVGAEGRKSPPVELLTAYEEVIFLGETNSQLPKMIEKAILARDGKGWKRMVVLSIEDLSQAGRPGVSVAELIQERQGAEDFLRENAARISENLSLFRYEYVGMYGSLWVDGQGRRRVHSSYKLAGFDIRSSPASDIIDFPHDRHPQVDLYFQIAEKAIENNSARRIF